MCPIVGAEFRKDILDVTFHCLFGYGELGADLFIGISLSDQSQYVYFPRSQDIISPVLSDFGATSADRRFRPACTARIVSSSSCRNIPFNK